MRKSYIPISLVLVLALVAATTGVGPAFGNNSTDRTAVCCCGDDCRCGDSCRCDDTCTAACENGRSCDCENASQAASESCDCADCQCRPCACS